MGCQHLEDLYTLFLLGTLSEENSADLREHLERGCENCLERIREAALTVYLLSLACKPLRPNPKVKSQLLLNVRKK
jgi:hypothetical protein